MKAARPWARALVPVYRAALAAKEALRGVGLLPRRRLGWPVVSVGSLSAGGAGKTPLVIALATLLEDRGWTVDVLTRGYRRRGRGTEQVSLRAGAPAERYGDEPTLIAERTGVPVWVGANRFRSGERAEQQAAARLAPARTGENGEAEVAPCVHLLDDGLQHRALQRSFELVAVTAADLEDQLLPAGNLREGVSALRRADALAVRESELEALEGPLRALVGPDVPLWTVRRSLRFPAPLGVFGAGLRPLAFCALARPDNFAAMLANAGCGVVDTVIFPDHHRYDDADVTELVRLARSMEASGLVTTEKDAVKLQPAMRARLEAEIGPVMVVALDAAFVYESPVVRLLEARLRPGHQDAGQASEVGSH